MIMVTSLAVSPTKLTTRRSLWVTRAGWLLVVLLVGSMFVTSLPHVVRDVYYYERSVLQARDAAATLFPDYGAFVNYILVLRLLVVLIFWITAVFIAWRKADDWMVLYVSATLLMMSYLFAFRTNFDFWRFPAALERLFPAIDWAAPLLFGLCFLLLFYLFPDGRFMPRRLGWVLSAMLLLIFPLVYFAEWGILPDDYAWTSIALLIVTVFLVGAGSQAYRWQRANPIQKQQSRLVITALIAFISIPAIQLLLTNLFTSDSWIYFISLHVILIVAALIPLTIGISALRYRLWGMDALLNRTLVAGLLTAAILLVYILVVSAISFLFQTNINLLTAALATGIVALLVHPLRLWLQKLVNRLMYGERDDPLAVLAAMSRQLENTAVPSETLPALVETISQTLKLPYVAIESGGEEKGSGLVAETMANGRRPAEIQAYPLIYQGVSVGDLLVGLRGRGEVFTAEEERLLRSIARQAGTAVYAYQLTDQLQRSRERLITAREEERRRLRRDLHDGLGPQLAALTVKIDAVRNLMQSDPAAAETLLLEVKAESQEAIGEIRRVVDGLQPPALDQLGLLSALREFIAQQDALSETSFGFEHAGDIPALPAAIEVAAYRIATEAITNAGRHARARNCTVRLGMSSLCLDGIGIEKQIRIPNSEGQTADQLCMQIIDDGDGLSPAYTPGVGLISMRERALELGGAFDIDSQPGQGTAIRVTLPIPIIETGRANE